MAYTPDSELDREYLTTDTTQTITGNKTFDGSSTFNSSVVVNPTSPFYVKNNRVRFDTSGTEYGWIGTNGATDVRIDVSNGGELLTNNVPTVADSITNKSYVDGELANKLNSVVAGTNITVNNTDPNNPVINVTDVLNLASTTNTSAVTGDIWYDGTDVNIQGDTNVQGRIAPNGIDLTDASSNIVNSNASPVSLNISSGNATGTGANIQMLNSGSGDLRVNTTSKLTWDSDGVTINDVLNLASTTNTSAVTGDIWNDGTKINIEGGLKVKKGNSATPAFDILNSSNASVIGLYADADGDGQLIVNNSALGQILNVDSDANNGYHMLLNGIYRLGSTTNSSPTNGDIWYDSTNSEVTIQGTVKLNSQKLLATNFIDLVDTTGWGVRVDGSNDSLRPLVNNGASLGIGGGVNDRRWSKVWATDGDFSGSVNIGDVLNLVPRASDPSTPADGDIWYNGTDSKLKGREGGATFSLNKTLSKTFTLVGPTTSDNITIFRTDVAITVKEVIAVSTGTSPSTTYQLKHHTDRSNSGNALTSSETTTSTSTGDTATLSDATIPADSWIWFESTAVSGTDVFLTIDIRYTED